MSSICIGHNEFSKNFGGPKKSQRERETREKEKADVTLRWIVTKQLRGKEREKERKNEKESVRREELDIVLRVKNCA